MDYFIPVAAFNMVSVLFIGTLVLALSDIVFPFSNIFLGKDREKKFSVGPSPVIDNAI
jgi:hypothetical protein